ncbi:hypothetical protein J3F84DRAFT_404803 [Trichoderma pleuroticola]
MATTSQEPRLLDRVIEAHGGLDRWSRVKSIDVTFNVSGAFLELKGYPGHSQPTISVDVEKFTSVIQRLLGTNPDDRGYFDYDRTWLEARDGSIIKEYKQTRSSFKDHVRTTQWDDLQLI